MKNLWKAGLVLLIVLFGGYFWFFGWPYHATDLLTDSFVREPQNSKEVAISFVDNDEAIVRVSAYEGQINLLAHTWVSPKQIESLVRKDGGEIIGQFPTVGKYLISVVAGTEAEFIAKILMDPGVIDAFPRLVLRANRLVIIDEWTTDPDQWEPYVTLPTTPGGNFGETTDPKKAASHGDIVRYFLNGKIVGTDDFKKCLTEKRCGDMYEWGVELKIITANKDQKFILVNASYGSDVTGLKLKEGSKEFADAVNNAQTIFSKANFLNILGTSADSAKHISGKMFIVNAVGNDGANLTPSMEKLKKEKGWDRLISVGAVDKNGNILAYSNYSTNPKDILYAPVTDKVKGIDGKYSILDGTSFAAPQISYLLKEVLKKYPQLAQNPKLIKQMLFDTSVATKKESYVITKAGAGRLVRFYIIEDPYSPKTLRSALAVATKLLGLPPPINVSMDKFGNPILTPAPIPTPAPTPTPASPPKICWGPGSESQLCDEKCIATAKIHYDNKDACDWSCKFPVHLGLACFERCEATLKIHLEDRKECYGFCTEIMNACLGLRNQAREAY